MNGSSPHDTPPSAAGWTPSTFHLTIAYDGTRYSGWQVQPGQQTVQGKLERAAKVLLSKKKKKAMANAKQDSKAAAFRILGSGRTDAGVHALGQAARCVLPDWRADATAVLRGINSRLPEDIAVTDARAAVSSFHPIADAVSKRYRYQLQIGGDRDPFRSRTWFRIPGPLRIDLLHAAAAKFVGTHDFAAFQAAGAVRLSTVRTISHSVWTSAGDTPGDVKVALPSEGQRWSYEVEGDGFLYNMVRNLVGTMIEVARGHRSLDWIDEVLRCRDRKLAGETAPPHGLFLCQVNYPEEIFLSPSLFIHSTGKKAE